MAATGPSRKVRGERREEGKETVSLQRAVANSARREVLNCLIYRNITVTGLWPQRVIPLKNNSHLSVESRSMRDVGRLVSSSHVFSPWPEPCPHYHELRHRPTIQSRDTFERERSPPRETRGRLWQMQLPKPTGVQLPGNLGVLSGVSSELLVLSIPIEAEFSFQSCLIHSFLQVTNRPPQRTSTRDSLGTVR